VGRTRENKQQVINDLKGLLSETQFAFVIDYAGLSVAEITDLRNRIRPTGGICKVTKNTFMGMAIQGDEQWQPMEQFLSHNSAFLLVKEDISGAVKAYKAFRKDTKKTELRGGVLEGRALTKDQVEALGDLPTKDQLYGQIAGAINAIATKVAFGIKEIPSSLARGIKAVSEQENQDAA
jgi:large subunit ribosomal protein L10